MSDSGDSGALVVAPPEEKKAVTVKERREELVRHRTEAIEDEDMNLMVWMTEGVKRLNRQAVLEGTQQKPEGWSDEQFNVACCAMLSKKEAPIALAAAVERGVNRIRHQAESVGRTGGGSNITLVIPQMLSPDQRTGKCVVTTVDQQGRVIDAEEVK